MGFGVIVYLFRLGRGPFGVSPVQFRTHSVSRVLLSALAHVALLPAASAATSRHGPRLLSQGRQEQRSAPTPEAVAPEPGPVTSY